MRLPAGLALKQSPLIISHVFPSLRLSETKGSTDARLCQNCFSCQSEIGRFKTINVGRHVCIFFKFKSIKGEEYESGKKKKPQQLGNHVTVFQDNASLLRGLDGKCHIGCSNINRKYPENPHRAPSVGFTWGRGSFSIAISS